MGHKYLLILVCIYVTLLKSCHKPQGCSEGYTQWKIYNSIKICLPKPYRLIACRPDLSIKNFDGGDMNWEDSLFFNSMDSTFIVIHTAGVIDTPDTFRSSCLIRQWVTVKKYVYASGNLKDQEYIGKYNYISSISAGFFYKNNRHAAIEFFFNKFKNETIQAQVTRAVKILRTLEIDNIPTCIRNDNIESFRDADWGRYVDSYDTLGGKP